MRTFFALMNDTTIGIIFCWAVYHAHVTASRFKRISFTLLAFSTSVIFLLSLLPIEDNYYSRNYFWQSLLFTASIALYCIADFYTEYGTERFVEAFQNNKKRLMDLTKH